MHHQILDFNDRVGCAVCHDHIPIAAKKMAKAPSITITRKIALTTESVVLAPSDSAEPFTCKPSAQATSPITTAMKGAFIIPTAKVCTETESCRRDMNTVGSIPP